MAPRFDDVFDEGLRREQMRTLFEQFPNNSVLASPIEVKHTQVESPLRDQEKINNPAS